MTKKLVLRTLLGMLVVYAFIATQEGQLLSISASNARHFVTPQTSDLFDADRVHSLDASDSFTMLAAGDIAGCRAAIISNQTIRNFQYSFGLDRSEALPNDGMVHTVRLLEDNPDAIVLALGDLVYPGGEPVNFEDCYDPFWGAARDRTWPTPGNHEYRAPYAYGYFDYWGDRAGPDMRGYYALRSEDWLFLSLNSEIDASAGSRQADWIRQTLSAFPDHCLAVFFHKPAFSTEDRNDSEAARDLFGIVANAGAQFVLSGHNHFYERTQALNADGLPSDDGTVQFVVGTGGRTSSGSFDLASFDDRLIVGNSGVLRLDFTPNAVDWEYLFGEESVEADSGTISCR